MQGYGNHADYANSRHHLLEERAICEAIIRQVIYLTDQTF